MDAGQAYPLVYVRSSREEKILVIINPSGKEQRFSCAYLPEKPIYTNGKEACFADGVVKVPPKHAGYYKL